MEYNYDSLIDENLVHECDQIRSIAKKSWLSSAGVSLAHLDNVKATVYNVGLADPKELKATNLREKKNRAFNDLPTNPPLSTVSLQQTAACSGSNSSIPDLIRQHSSDSLHKPTRPASASIRKTRPPSGRRTRPQSAKELLPSSDPDTGQPFGVKGAKYDPSGRPPKGIPSSTTTGWVGPPAGLRYPDRPPSGQGWKLEFSKEIDHDVRQAPPPPQGTPVPPASSPEPLEQEEKTKRVFELFIGDPYKTADDQEDEELFEDSDTDTLSPVDQAPPRVLLRKPASESLRLSLPAVDDDESFEEMDTERLLHEAEMMTKKLDLQAVFKLNKVSEPLDSTGHSPSPPAGLASENKAEHVPISSASQKREPPGWANEKKIFVHTASPVSDNDHHNKLLADINIEEDVSTMVCDDLDNEFCDSNNNNSNQGNNFYADDVLDKEDCNERKGIINEHRDKTNLEHVKFSEDKNVTVDITPRNLGRKVTELAPNKSKKTQNDSFIDLIEVKNRIEPVLQTGKVSISPRKVSPPNRPPSGKLRTTLSSQAQKGVVNDKRQSGMINQKLGNNKNIMNVTSTSCSKMSSGRPRSAPLNRAVSPVTTVTVDYGEDPADKQDEESRSEHKPKKKKARSKDDVVTMMQKIGLSDGEFQGEMQNSTNHKRDNIESVNNDGSVISDDNFAKFDSNTGQLVSTMCKSVPEKNYYELARHSGAPNKSNVKEEETTSHVYKTTKTIEFDELEPKELSIKSVIDPLLILAKEKDRFLSSPENKETKRGRTPSRPPSANLAKKPPVPNEGQSDSLERPESRIGFVAMAPDKSPTSQKKETKQTLHRPSSAPVNRHIQSLKQQKGKDAKSSTPKSGMTAGQTVLTDKEKAEKEKVIDNLLERTKTLLGQEDGSQDTEKKKVCPTSAYVGIARCKDQRRVKSAGVRRPVSSKTIGHRHTHTVSTKTPRKSSGKKRTVVTEPCIINTNTSFDEDETEEDLLCQEMEKGLAERGVNVKAETLQRALYPPSGRTKYYRLTADLPRSNSLTLLSHPKNWLPQEYKRLQKAEKTLSRANEIMYLQHRAEQRREKLAELGPEAQKKKKKKGKKGGKKLRRSNSFG